MTPRAAIDFVRTRGVVLESAAGPAPTLAAIIAGEAIRGTWWAHRRAREIYAAAQAVRACEDVLVCRLLDGKITYVDRRLWPALVRAAALFPKARLARVRAIHTPSGRHIVDETAFPRWAPAAVVREAAKLSADEALGMLAEKGVVPPAGERPARRRAAVGRRRSDPH